MTALELGRGDITAVECDAIVNAANPSLLGGGGVDGAIHRAAGPSLLAECREVIARIGRCEPGTAVITGAGNLAARHVIHTVGPVWQDGRDAELDAVLARCYEASLDLAMAHSLRSIAFPNISTGVYRFPKGRAARVALHAVRDTLDRAGTDHGLDRVVFVCFDETNARHYEDLIAS